MAEDWKLPRIGTSGDPLRIAILISGSGSGMEALIRHQQANECSTPARIDRQNRKATKS